MELSDQVAFVSHEPLPLRSRQDRAKLDDSREYGSSLLLWALVVLVLTAVAMSWWPGTL